MRLDTTLKAAEPALLPFAELAATALSVQQAQLEAFAAWQASIAALQRELWDEWISHWAGGVPIDA